MRFDIAPQPIQISQAKCPSRKELRANEGVPVIIDLWEGLSHAFWMVVTFDAELVSIVLRSLHVTLTAVVVASFLSLPLAAFLAIRRFRWRRQVIAVLNALSLIHI